MAYFTLCLIQSREGSRVPSFGGHANQPSERTWSKYNLAVSSPSPAPPERCIRHGMRFTTV